MSMPGFKAEAALEISGGQLTIVASASTHSTTAAATSSSVAGAAPRVAAVPSEKMGRTSNVHRGQIPSAPESLAANNTPATSVPCTHASVSARSHCLRQADEAPTIVAPERCG